MTPKMTNDKEKIRLHGLKGTVTNLVYKYLEKIAERNAMRKRQNTACKKFRRKHKRRSIGGPRLLDEGGAFYNAVGGLESSKGFRDNRIKSYIQMALALACEMGYLVYADPDSRLVRVSSTLKY